MGGSLHWDSAWLGDSNGNLVLPGSNATSTRNGGASLLRHARVRVDGHIYKSFDYAVEFDLPHAASALIVPPPSAKPVSPNSSPPSSGLSATFSPEAGEKGRGEGLRYNRVDLNRAEESGR